MSAARLIDGPTAVVAGWRVDTLYDMRRHTRRHGQFILERVGEDNQTKVALEQSYFTLAPHTQMPSANVNAVVDNLAKYINGRCQELGYSNLRVARIVFPLDCPSPLNREAGAQHGIIY